MLIIEQNPHSDLSLKMITSILCCLQVLTAYESTLDEVSKDDAYEHSEMLLFKATILEEASSLQDALNHLEKSQVLYDI